MSITNNEYFQKQLQHMTFCITFKSQNIKKKQVCPFLQDGKNKIHQKTDTNLEILSDFQSKLFTFQVNI